MDKSDRIFFLFQSAPSVTPLRPSVLDYPNRGVRTVGLALANRRRKGKPLPSGNLAPGAHGITTTDWLMVGAVAG